MKLLISWVALLLAVMLAALCLPVRADDMVWKNDTVLMRLQRTPCENPKVLALIPDAIHNEFRSGWVIFRGKSIALCWIGTGTDVTVIDEHGEGGTVAQSAFKREVGV